jgi:hypothetical protein
LTSVAGTEYNQQKSWRPLSNHTVSNTIKASWILFVSVKITRDLSIGAYPKWMIFIDGSAKIWQAR